jgi:ABC-type transport system involved in multi-copper enzyme maturation permease subunit
MLTIAAKQILESLLDLKFLFVAAVVLAAFAANGFFYSEKIANERGDWQELVNKNLADLGANHENLQDVSDFWQRVTRPVSTLSFVAADGAIRMPNLIDVNAFLVQGIERQSRDNEQIPLIPAFDWCFIVGVLMTLLAVLLGYDTVCGEKRDGTLRLVLSNPISRLSLFFGKYLGLLIIIIMTLLLGCLTSISILVFNGILALNEQIVTVLLWSFLLAVSCLSLFLLLAMAVSGIVSRPAVSLVVITTAWVIIIVAVPGLARMVAEQNVTVPSPYEIDKSISDMQISLWENAPRGAGNWSGDPFDWFMPGRAKLHQSIVSAEQKIISEAFRQKILQVRTLNIFSSPSPAVLLSDSLQCLSNTGVYGFENLIDYAGRYREQLHTFVVERDRLDSESAHLVYSEEDGSTEQGTFSIKPVEPSTIPRWHTMWAAGGLPTEQQWPVWQLVILLALNLQLAIAAFIALLCYDPR